MHICRSQYTKNTNASFNFNGMGKFVCLPFGLTSAPRVFSKIMKLVVGLLRQMGIQLVVSLDNILIMHHSEGELIQLTSLVRQLFEALGLTVNQEKSQLVPKQEIELLGFLVNLASLDQLRRRGKFSRMPEPSCTYN